MRAREAIVSALIAITTVAPARTSLGTDLILAGLRSRGAQNTILDVRCILFSLHPDAFLQRHPVNSTQTIGKDRKALFQTERFQVYKTGRIERSIPILIRSQIISTLVEKNF